MLTPHALHGLRWLAFVLLLCWILASLVTAGVHLATGEPWLLFGLLTGGAGVPALAWLGRRVGPWVSA